jgi:hypothetical protein
MYMYMRESLCIGHLILLHARLNWPPNAPLCDDLAYWRVLPRFPVKLYLCFNKATREISVITSREDVRTCGPQPRGKCNKPRGGITMQCFRSSGFTSYIPTEILSMVWIRGLRRFDESTPEWDTLFPLAHMCHPRHDLWQLYPVDICISRRFPRRNPKLLLTLRDGYAISCVGFEWLTFSFISEVRWTLRNRHRIRNYSAIFESNPWTRIHPPCSYFSQIKTGRA